MNPAVALAVFPVIFVAELPDKTMAASLVLAMRGRALAVWLGGAAAFAVHVLIATTVGILVFRLLPDRAVDGLVAAVFFAGAVMTAREAWRGRRLEESPHASPDPHAQASLPAAGGGTRNGAGPLLRTALTAFFVIFTAEWGDLTQILTVNLTVRYHAPLSVGVGALLALWSVAALAVAGGRRLSAVVSPAILRAVTALALAGFACYSAWGALT